MGWMVERLNNKSSAASYRTIHNIINNSMHKNQISYFNLFNMVSLNT